MPAEASEKRPLPDAAHPHARPANADICCLAPETLAAVRRRNRYAMGGVRALPMVQAMNRHVVCGTEREMLITTKRPRRKNVQRHASFLQSRPPA